MTDEALLRDSIIRNVGEIGIPLVGLRVMPRAVRVVRAVSPGHQDVLVDPAHTGRVWTELG